MERASQQREPSALQQLPPGLFSQTTSVSVQMGVPKSHHIVRRHSKHSTLAKGEIAISALDPAPFARVFQQRVEWEV